MADSGYTYLIEIDTNGNVVLPALQQNAAKTDKALNALGLHAKEGFIMFGREAGKANGMLQQLKSTALSLGVGMGLAAMGKTIVQTGVAFEKEMSNVGAISNATAGELATLTQAARQAGATTVFSATEAAQAMSFLAQAGYKANEQIAALPGTLDMAAAANMGLAQAADVTVSILSQYQMQARDAIVVSDQLAYTANAFNTNVSEVAEAMKYLGPTAHAFGISLAESNAVIGLLSNGGLKGSMATRALGTSISRLAAPTRMMQQAMDELGLQVFDANGQFVGMANMIKQVEKSFEGLTDQQKQGYLSKIFSSESLQEMNILLAAGGDAVAQWTDKIDASMGEAARVAKEKLNNLAGDVKLFQSVMEEQYLSLYDKMQPALRSLVQDATAFISAMDTTALANTLGGFAQGLAQVGMALVKITGFVMKHWQALMAMAKMYVSIKAFMLTYNATVRATIAMQKAWTVATQMYTTVTKGAAVATGALSTALKLSPWGLIAGLVTAAATAMALFSKNTRDASAAQNELSMAEEEAKQRRRDHRLISADTERDWQQAQAGVLDDRQKERVKQAASMRIEQIDDMLSLIDFEAKKNKGYLEKQGYLQEAKDKGMDWMVPNYEKELEWIRNSIANDLGFGLTYQELQQTRRQNVGLGFLKTNSSANTPGSTALPTGVEAAGNISKGGASQKIINIQIGKFQDEVNINVAAGDREGEAIGRELQDVVNEQLMRILNSANALAG